jgi:Family of unknown function (DUF5947)
MSPEPIPGDDRPGVFASLRRYARQPALRERCELCSAAVPDEHAHLVEPASGRMVCACNACALLFADRMDGKFRRVPRAVRFLADFHLTDESWEALELPINLAFLVHSTRAGRVVAFYPSPAGATEASVPAEAWGMLVEDNPNLRSLEPDVEALLVNRTGGQSSCYRLGVDECYKLVGIVRTHWRGMSGGTEVWREIGRFFATLRERSGGGRPAHA